MTTLDEIHANIEKARRLSFYSVAASGFAAGMAVMNLIWIVGLFLL